jgi:uncharacterized membrane protein YdbT with pleckstrin-like domain
MGNYINNNLIKDEVLVYETKYHWIIYFNLLTLLTGGLYALYLIVKQNNSEFGITNKRLIIKTGIISRNTLELNLSKIESVNVNQSILGRMLGYGTLGVIGTGGTKEIFAKINNPIQFRKKFQELSN